MSHLTVKDELRRLRSNVAAMGMRPSAHDTPTASCDQTIAEGLSPLHFGSIALTSDERPAPRTARRFFKSTAGWLLSTVLHAVLIVVLGLTMFSVDSLERWVGVDLAIAQHDTRLDPNELQAIEIQALAMEPASGGQDSSESLHINTLDTLAQAPPILDFSHLLAGGHTLVDDVAAMVGDGRDLGAALAGQRRGQGTGTGDGRGGTGEGEGYAMFYGSAAAGKDFAFVVDCSGSMTGRRWEAACNELMSSIVELDAEQRFYVVFFNHEEFPQFYPVIDNFLSRADAGNVDKFSQWMRNVRPMGGTDPSHALRRVLELQPDAVFLLSDGEFPLAPTMNVLNKHNRAQTVVHTIALGSMEGQRMLIAIAQATGGTYRFVPLY